MEIVTEERTYEGIPPMPAIVMAAMEECGIRKLIDDRCHQIDSKDHALSPGMAVKALVGAMIERGKRPLYRIQDYYSAAPTDLIFGNGVFPSSLSDTNLADRMDTVFRTDMRQLLSESYRLLQKKYGFDTGNMFMDATNYTMYGLKYSETQEDYDSYMAEHGLIPKESPIPSFGIPKNKRNDLVQLNLSHVVDGNGIPICSNSYDGNLSDITMNRDMIGYLKKNFDMSKSILMADCKLCVEDVLLDLDNGGIKFVTKVPANFNRKLRESMVESVLFGNMDESKTRPGRLLYETDDEISGRKCRVISYILPKSRKDAEKFLRTKGLEDAKKALKKLSRKRFFCEDDAKDAFRNATAATSMECYDADLDVVEDKVTERRYGDGKKFRPVSSNVRINESRLEKAITEHALRVLITNIPFADSSSDDKISCASADDVVDLYLEEYKVEAGFKMMKSGMNIGNVYIHTPARIAAMAFIVSLATMIVTTLDRIHSERKPKGERKKTVRTMADIHVSTLVKYDRRHDRLSIVGYPGATKEIFDYLEILEINPQYLLGY